MWVGREQLGFGSSERPEPPHFGAHCCFHTGPVKVSAAHLYHGNSLWAWGGLGWFWYQQQLPAQGVKLLMPSWWVLGWFWMRRASHGCVKKGIWVNPR